ncbi:OmpA family protein [Dyella jiangningensis]|uniref:OmpA family protein n=1 Tax=Dyella jiangningensis TaxID=1379159 RepID=UPI00240F5129|nr:OmpA family protein [Dyella jiangningensis]MDG2539833.1 OmpA family protein [Dyella jiangningensis]
MLGPKIVIKRGRKEEAEKPFWISFSDMMTALMVLFLVVMAVALLSIPKKVLETEDGSRAHQRKIAEVLDKLAEAAKRYPGIVVDKERGAINFGPRARFDFGKWQLDPAKETVLREFTPEILTLANDEVGKSVLKRVVVEGYTDRKGTYLANLNLSLLRSQRVLCALFADSGSSLLTDEQKEEVRRLFFVGGYSFNASKESDEESRRVEMRLEFLALGETRPEPPAGEVSIGECALR